MKLAVSYGVPHSLVRDFPFEVMTVAQRFTVWTDEQGRTVGKWEKVRGPGACAQPGLYDAYPKPPPHGKRTRK